MQRALHNVTRTAVAVSLLWFAYIPTPSAAFPPDDVIRNILVDRIDTQKRSVGIVVGLIEPSGQRVVCYGRMGGEGSQRVRPDTVFEIGSVTKVVTALALSVAIELGEVRPTDPVAGYLPDVDVLRKFDGTPIALVDLATHASGLPMWAPGASPTTGFARLATYRDEDLYAYLRNYTPEPDTRTWAYSNVGVGLLGLALARRAGTSYATLVRQRITAPLGMADTGVSLTPSMAERRASGHFADLRAAPAWTLPALEGAASLHSTADDMVRFLAAFLGYQRTHLAPAMHAMLAVSGPGPEPGLTQAMGWLVSEGAGDRYVQFGGATAGFAAFLSFRPSTKQGIVVLSNSSEPVGDIGNHLIRPNHPLSRARRRITLDVALLDRYVGTYEAAPNVVFTIERAGDSLTLRPPNLQMTFTLFPESEETFYAPQLGLAVAFDFDAQRNVIAASTARGDEAPVPARKLPPDSTQPHDDATASPGHHPP